MADSALNLPTLGGSISDAAYDPTTWNGDTTNAPSKNAMRDILVRMPTDGQMVAADRGMQMP